MFVKCEAYLADDDGNQRSARKEIYDNHQDEINFMSYGGLITRMVILIAGECTYVELKPWVSRNGEIVHVTPNKDGFVVFEGEKLE